MQKYSVLLYSDDQLVRERMRLAIGPRPATDVSVEFVDAATIGEVLRLLDGENRPDLLLLDGEAAPAGGLGIARQVKDDYPDAPPTIVAIARAADRWLAAYANVDATLLFPLDPMETAAVVAGVLRKGSAS